ncbi:10076_t:CDS:2 [Paraglomus brasilianum]|uniref:10076_t:CDS:1 n=1 Tax=Paraglomus brasilianum TaxID=144538 RepID=A0A9N9AVR4_9GLOM|nr:10076_t:CDS:2 [Paraglomus brasilianum]
MSATPDITLYTFSTPNGHKASITLEELGIPYKVHKVSLMSGEQRQEWFLKINPNGMIPAIVDHSRGDFSVFESGAIMIYLCEHYDPEGKLLPKDPNLRSETIQWIMFHASGVAPMQLQASHFLKWAPEAIPYSIARYVKETRRLYSVLESRLQDREFLVGDSLTLADIINFTWVYTAPSINLNLDEYPNVKNWIARIEARPAVQKGLDVPDQNSTRELRAGRTEVSPVVKERFALL